MSWVKLDDGFWNHPKVLTLSDGAFRLYVRSLSYAGRYLTDGELRPSVVRLLGAKTRHIAELVGENLWEDGQSGYVIHDFLEYNPSRDEVDAERDKTAEQRRRAGVASGAARRRTKHERETNGPFERNTNEMRTVPLNPVPSRPVPISDLIPNGIISGEKQGKTGQVLDILGAAGVSLNVRQQQDVAEMVIDDGYEPEWFGKAAAKARTNGTANWSYVKSILDGWRQNGPPKEARNGTRRNDTAAGSPDPYLRDDGPRIVAERAERDAREARGRV